MRRDGHIIEEIVEYANIAESFDQVLRGTKRKKSRQGRYLIAHREEVIKELTHRIADGSFTVQDYREREIREGGKTRRIQILTMKDRIAVHAVMAVIDRHLRRRFIRTTAASIKERGMHDLMAYIRDDIKRAPPPIATSSTFQSSTSLYHKTLSWSAYAVFSRTISSFAYSTDSFA